MKLVIVESPFAPTTPRVVRPVCGCPHWSVFAPGEKRTYCAMCESDRVRAEELRHNVGYARAALRDCLLRGESPYASHLLYTQDGVLDDTIAAERDHGIRAGFEWRQVAQATVVYSDLGISKGMQYGIDDALKRNIPVEYRSIVGWQK